MTDKLHDAMRSQADAAGFPPIDLDAVMAGGARRVRRRRAAGAAGAVAGIAATVALVVTLALPDKVETAPDPALPFPTAPRDLDQVVADSGRILVVGQPEIAVDGNVTRLERTLDDGFAYVTDDDDFDDEPGTVHFLRDGVTTDLGTGSDLVADADGHVAAWTHREGATTTMVVLDTRDLTTTQTPLTHTTGAKDPIRLRDVDGQTAYLHDGRGEIGLDLVTGKVEPVDGTVVDVEDDVTVVSVPDDTNEFGTSLYAETSAGRVLLPSTQGGVLSPDGTRFLTPDADAPPGEGVGPTADLVDTATGERVSLDYESAIADEALAVDPVGWLDDDTVSLLWVADNRQEIESKLLTCDVPTRQCEVSADVEAVVGNKEGLQVFSGMPLYQRSFLD